MKRLLLPLLAALAFPTAVNANVDPEVRKLCLPAADFEGCVRSYTQPREQVKVEKLDFLGKPIIPNWEMLEEIANNRVIYIDKFVKKVKARGQFGRYISFDNVLRWYQEPVAGTSGTSTQIGSNKTNCLSTDGAYSTSINCTTTPAPILNIPGRSAVAEGVRQRKYTAVIDCLDEKYKNFGQEKQWKPFERNSIIANLAEENCHVISELPPSNFKKFIKGKPNKKDKIAINTLSSRYNKYKIFGFKFNKENKFDTLLVESVMKGSSAEYGGVRKNDLILEINNISTKGLNNLEIIRLLEPNNVTLKIQRDGTIKNISLNKTTIKRFILTKS